MTTIQHFHEGDYVVPHPPGGRVTSVEGMTLQQGEARVHRIRDVGVRQQVLLTCTTNENGWFEGENFRRAQAA